MSTATDTNPRSRPGDSTLAAAAARGSQLFRRWLWLWPCLGLLVTAAVGLKEDEATVLLNIVQSLGHLKKSAKPKVLAALAKLFG